VPCWETFSWRDAGKPQKLQVRWKRFWTGTLSTLNMSDADYHCSSQLILFMESSTGSINTRCDKLSINLPFNLNLRSPNYHRAPFISIPTFVILYLHHEVMCQRYNTPDNFYVRSGRMFMAALPHPNPTTKKMSHLSRPQSRVEYSSNLQNICNYVTWIY